MHCKDVQVNKQHDSVVSDTTRLSVPSRTEFTGRIDLPDPLASAVVRVYPHNRERGISARGGPLQ